MKFVIITHAVHKLRNNHIYTYEPYVREMNLWIKYVDEVLIVAPVSKEKVTSIESKYLFNKRHSALDAESHDLKTTEEMLKQVQHDGKQSHSQLDWESHGRKSNNEMLNQVQHNDKKIIINIIKIPSFNIASLKNGINAIFKIPAILFKIYNAMQWADHIHLRCPGNIGLLGCFVQIMFPNKPKTIKYAGNWDPKSKQPLSYRLQKWILSNTFLTKNAKVLVYGEWPNQTKNIVSFFTATYSEREITECHSEQREAISSGEQIATSQTPRNDEKERHSALEAESFVLKTDDKTQNQVKHDGKIIFLFTGALTKGKQPLLSVKVVHKLKTKGYNVQLDIYGDGSERNNVEKYIEKHQLQNIIKLHGNVSKETLKEAYQKSHFLLLLSKSEGWPKVVAEAMFWGCVPITSRVSCVPWMLANGERGLLVDNDIDGIISSIESLFTDKEAYHQMSLNAQKWSQQYTLEYYEKEIKKLLN